MRTRDGSAIDDIEALVCSGVRPGASEAGITTLGIDRFHQCKADEGAGTKIAQMAQDGSARPINPSHTMYDGDTIFGLATGDLAYADTSTIGALAADMTSEAIERAVNAARGTQGYPAARDLSRR